MFGNILSLFTGGSTTAYLVAGALLLGGYGGWFATSDYYEAKIAKVNTEATEHVNKIIEEQGVIAQQTQKDKDEVQNRYDTVVAQLRGLHNASVSTNGNTSAPIPSQGLRLLEPDAEVLVGFAQQCANTEIERNDVIQKYNALRNK